MGISESEIARLAGVSRKSVYNAIHRPESVGDEKRKKILALVEKHHFRPDFYMSRLKKGTNPYICLIAVESLGPFIRELIEHILAGVSATPYEMVIAQKPDPMAFLLDSLASKRFAGYFLFSSAEPSDEQLERIRDAQVPLVGFGGRLSRHGFPVVTWDIEDHVDRILSAISEKGHKNLGLITAGREGKPDLNEARTLAFLNRCERFGIHIDPVWIFQGGDDLGRSTEIVRALQQMSPRPTVLFGFNDLTCIAIMAAMSRVGLRVPEDISLVGMDGIQLGVHVHPRLTTLEQDMSRYAGELVKTLMELLQTPTPWGKDKKYPLIRVPGNLVLRESLGAPPGL